MSQNQIDLATIEDEQARRLEQRDAYLEEIENEISRREDNLTNRLVSIFCPISGIERCGLVGYNESRCAECRTAEEFFDNCPVKNYADSESLCTNIIVGFIDAVFTSIFNPDGEETTKSLSDLTDDELEKMHVLVQLKTGIQNSDEPYQPAIIDVANKFRINERSVAKLVLAFENSF